VSPGFALFTPDVLVAVTVHVGGVIARTPAVPSGSHPGVLSGGAGVVAVGVGVDDVGEEHERRLCSGAGLCSKDGLGVGALSSASAGQPVIPDEHLPLSALCALAASTSPEGLTWWLCSPVYTWPRLEASAAGSWVVGSTCWRSAGRPIATGGSAVLAGCASTTAMAITQAAGTSSVVTKRRALTHCLPDGAGSPYPAQRLGSLSSVRNRPLTHGSERVNLTGTFPFDLETDLFAQC
jgi:hypothetical protein